MEHIQGDQWWTDYQAVSYKIQSKRGDRDAFAAMVSACHVEGVKVIVDVIFNHMTGIDGGVGVAGTSFSHFNYPGLYTNTVSWTPSYAHLPQNAHLPSIGLPSLWYEDIHHSFMIFD